MGGNLGIGITVCGDWEYNRLVNSRSMGDRMYMTIIQNGLKEISVFPYFLVRSSTTNIAGHNGNPTFVFMYDTPEAAAEKKLSAGKLVAGKYEFMEDNMKSLYEDLKSKLTSLYGAPFADTTNSDEIWGPVDLPEVEADMIKSMKKQFEKSKYTVWKNTANDRMIILTFWDQGNQSAELVYFDLSAEDALEKMYWELARDEDSDTQTDSALQGL